MQGLHFEVHKKTKTKTLKTMRSRAYENNTVNMAYLKSSHIVPEETKNKQTKTVKDHKSHTKARCHYH